jgi:hypothetical protein
MRAHGQTPGPGQRPRLAGALAGLISGVFGISILEWSRASDSLATALRLEGWIVAALFALVATVAGAVYGAIFRRAANDRRGGWLFGISYGFLLWMVGPVTILQTVVGRPLATGTAAMGVLAANLVFGLILGLLFRPAHRLIRNTAWERPTQRLEKADAREDRVVPAGFPHTIRDPR